METAHLLRSPKNAERLLQALARAQGETVAPQGVEELRQSLHLGRGVRLEDVGAELPDE